MALLLLLPLVAIALTTIAIITKPRNYLKNPHFFTTCISVLLGHVVFVTEQEACSSHGDRAGGVKRNRTAISVELKQAVCEYAQQHSAETQTAVATWFLQKYNIHPPVQRSTIGKILVRKDEFLEIDENHPSLRRAMLRNPKWPVLG